MNTRAMSVFAGVLAALAAAPLSSAPAVPPVPELPVETFFQAPALSNLVFSPNGKYVLCLVPYERRLNLAVIDLEKGTKNLLTNFKDRQAGGPLWANNDRILFRVDDDGQESYSLYAVNRDGSERNILASGYSRFGSTGQVNDRFVDILRRLKDDDRSILVLARITHSSWIDVARMNLKTGKMTVVARSPGEEAEYVLDHNDVVRVATVREGARRKVLHRQENGRPWEEIFSAGLDEPGWEPIAFEGDNRTLFVWSNLGRRTRAIYRYDTATRTLGDMVVGDDIHDFKPTYGESRKVYFDPSKHKVIGFGYETERTRFHWLDPEMERLHRKLEEALPDTVHQITQISEDGQRIIFSSYSARDPGVYYLYDKGRGKLEELAVVRPQVDPAQMAPVKPIIYAARDGLLLHGYLTLPVGRAPEKLPLVVHPHGGPYGPRDHWVYDPEVQFYANRGFAVLQVNFRGSGGYGDWFEAAGWKKWGLEMQDDITDGVKWAVAQGIADPARIVISGASYGGYATMAGLTFTPELYCAGINYVGVVNINNLIPKGQPADRMRWMNTRIADVGDAAERQRLHDTSPVHFADRIRVPVLMAYGRNDPRVPIDQAYDIERALKRSNVPYDLIIEDDEGHGFRKEEKRIAFYAQVDAFLKKQVPGVGRKAEVTIKPAEVVEMPARTPPGN